jgi:hypothetical protein
MSTPAKQLEAGGDLTAFQTAEVLVQEADAHPMFVRCAQRRSFYSSTDLSAVHSVWLQFHTVDLCKYSQMPPASKYPGTERVYLMPART